MDYSPVEITSLFHNTDFTRNTIKGKTIYPFSKNSLKPLVGIYGLYQSIFLERKVIKELSEIKKVNPFLSDVVICKSKGEQLLEKLDEVKLKYQEIGNFIN